MAPSITFLFKPVWLKCLEIWICPLFSYCMLDFCEVFLACSDIVSRFVCCFPCADAVTVWLVDVRRLSLRSVHWNWSVRGRIQCEQHTSLWAGVCVQSVISCQGDSSCCTPSPDPPFPSPLPTWCCHRDNGMNCKSTSLNALPPYAHIHSTQGMWVYERSSTINCIVCLSTVSVHSTQSIDQPMLN